MTENRLKELDERILKLERLKTVSFRKNLFENVEALKDLRCAGVLAELVLYDNLIKRLPSLENFKAIKKLDFSYNKVTPLPFRASLRSDLCARSRAWFRVGNASICRR